MDATLACHQPVVLTMLATELADTSKSAVARKAAGRQLMNYLKAKDPAVKLQYQRQWLDMDAAIKLKVKSLVSQCGVEFGVMCVYEIEGMSATARWSKLWEQRPPSPW